MKYFLSILSFAFIFSHYTFGQKVSNVDFYIEGPKVIVTYDLDRNADVYLFASTCATDGWNTSYMNYSAYRAMAPALRAVEGDVGKNVTPGHKTAIWYFKEEVSCFFHQDAETGLGTFVVYTAAWEKQIREKRGSMNGNDASRYSNTSLAPTLFNSIEMKVEVYPTTPEPEMVYIDGCDGLGDYWVGKYEVTVAEFAAFVKDTKYITDAEKRGAGEIWSKSKKNYEERKGVNWRHDEYGNLRPSSVYSLFPVVNVSHNDAMAYCKWLSEKFNKSYYLPSVADWIEVASEYMPGAVSWGGATGTDFAGASEGLEIGWFSQNSNYSIKRKGEKYPNRLHIYDMSGNVNEWLYNGVDSSNEVTRGYTEPTGTIRLGIGGSCFEEKRTLDESLGTWEKNSSNVNVGFRVMMRVGKLNNWVTGEKVK